MNSLLREPRRTFARAVRISPPVFSLLVIGVIGFATSTLSARLLGPAGRGQLLVIQVVPLFLTSLSAGGVPEALLYARPLGETPASLRRAAVGISLRSSVVAVVGGLIFLAVFRRTSALLVPAAVSLLVAPLTAHYEVAIAFHRRQQRLVLWSILRLAQPLLWLGVLGIGFTLGTRSAALLSYLQVGCYALLVGASLHWLLRGVQRAQSSPLSNDLRRKARTALVAQFFKILTLRLDLLMVPFFAPDVQVGWYAASTSWSWIATPWLSGLASALAPTMQANKREVDRSLVRRLLVFGLVATCGIAALGWLGTNIAFTFVYGEAYAPARGFAAVLMVAGSLTAFNLWAGELARSANRMWLPAVAEFPSVVVFLFVLLAWKASWGAPKAAAVGSLAGYLTTAIIFAIGLLLRSRAPTFEGAESATTSRANAE